MGDNFTDYEDMPESAVYCPVCGYYCLGKGGHGCIDKPSMIRKIIKEEIEPENIGG